MGNSTYLSNTKQSLIYDFITVYDMQGTFAETDDKLLFESLKKKFGVH